MTLIISLVVVIVLLIILIFGVASNNSIIAYDDDGNIYDIELTNSHHLSNTFPASRFKEVGDKRTVSLLVSCKLINNNKKSKRKIRKKETALMTETKRGIL